VVPWSILVLSFMDSVGPAKSQRPENKDPYISPAQREGQKNPFSYSKTRFSEFETRIIAVGGGKGGVGKSLVASSLAILLGREQDLVAIDLDLGGANLHTALGQEPPRKTLSTFIHSQSGTLAECIAPTSHPGVSLISGAQDALGAANIGFAEKVRLFEGLRGLDVDYTLLDLGAGSHFNTVDFFLAADFGVVVLTPEASSIENAYRFVRSVYYRRLFFSKKLRSVRPLIEDAMGNSLTQTIKTPKELYKSINQLSPQLGESMMEEVERLKMGLVVNQARSQADRELGAAVKTVFKKYFGIPVHDLGHVDFDSCVWQSAQRKRSFLQEYPTSKAAADMKRVADNLLMQHSMQLKFSFERGKTVEQTAPEAEMVVVAQEPLRDVQIEPV